MKIHEYQAKEILRRFGIPTPRGGVATSGEEARKICADLGGRVWVVKSQIHAGGRGKGTVVKKDDHETVVLEGGVRLVKTPQEAGDITEKIVGNVLKTHQNPAGKEVLRVLVEEGCDIDRELYVAAVLDRARGRVCLMASTEGGVEIEEVAAKTPEKIVKTWIEPGFGLQDFQATRMALALGLGGDALTEGKKLLTALVACFESTDASLAEINPCVVTKDGHVLALDAKINFDDNGLYRQADVLKYRDLTEEDEAEVEASKWNLNYIQLDGSIGCMVNGAGLAMATMDIIKHHGAEPANFLDVGGGAGAEQVEAAFKIILGDKRVKAILINIFGGIIRCDVIAKGVIEAARQVNLSVPVVVRLEGNMAKEGLELLNNAGLSVITAASLEEGAQKAVEAAGP